MKARIISVVGETHLLLEDLFVVDYNGVRLKAAVGDWANNLEGGLFEDEETARLINDESSRKYNYNGGVIGSALAKKAIAQSEESGHSLIELINRELEGKYKQLGIEGYRENRALTFTGYIAHVVVNPAEICVTAVGDVRIAADGIVIAGAAKKIDIHNAWLRSQYIKETGDFEGGYRHVRPNIIAQYKFQNTPGYEFSYPAIDGTETLPEGIEIKIIKTPQHVLLWSDGYLTPDYFSIEGLEKKLEEVYREDPYRHMKYPAVGHPKDDRTAVEIILDGWNDLAVEYVLPKFA